MYNFDTNIGTPTMNSLASQLVTAYRHHAIQMNVAHWTSAKNVILAHFQPACINYVTKMLNRQLAAKVPTGQPYLGF